MSALIGSRYGKKYFLKAAKQTTGIASINSTQLKAFPLILAPVDLQNKFGGIAKAVLALKSKYAQSLAQLENLYGSLGQRVFKGEFDLSRVPIHYSPKTQGVKIKLTPSAEVKVLHKYTKDLLLKIISSAEDGLAFADLWSELQKMNFEPEIRYEEVKDDIFSMLSAQNPFLVQRSLESKNKIGKLAKKIVLSVLK